MTTEVMHDVVALGLVQRVSPLLDRDAASLQEGDALLHLSAIEVMAEMKDAA